MNLYAGMAWSPSKLRDPTDLSAADVPKILDAMKLFVQNMIFMGRRSPGPGWWNNYLRNAWKYDYLQCTRQADALYQILVHLKDNNEFDDDWVFLREERRIEAPVMSDN